MDFNLNEEQEMLKKMARDFLADKCPKALVRQMEKDERGYSPELWQEMAGLGWMGLTFPEKYGGSGMGFLDLAVLLEEIGRAALVSPFFATVILAGLPLLDAGSEEQKRQFLTGIASGKTIMTLALTEEDGQHEPRSIKTGAMADGESYRINGTKLFVPDAHVADYIICAARTGQAENDVTLFIVDAKTPGISLTPLQTIAGDKQFEVAFHNVRVPAASMLGKLNGGWDILDPLLAKAAVARCCGMVGGMQRIQEMTVEYARTRKQFDKPIGVQQIVQHYCVMIATDVDGARFMTNQAAWALNEGRPAAKEVAMATAWASEAFGRVTTLAHQVHGAIGVTQDHDLQFYTRQGKAADLTFGDADFYREKVAQAMGL